MENNKNFPTVGNVIFTAFVQAAVVLLALWAWSCLKPKPPVVVLEPSPAAIKADESPSILLKGSYMAVLSTVDGATKIAHHERWGQILVSPGNLLDSVTAIQSLPVWNEGGADFVGIPDDSDSGIRFISKRSLKGVEEPLPPDAKVWVLLWAPGEPH